MASIFRIYVEHRRAGDSSGTEAGTELLGRGQAGDADFAVEADASGEFAEHAGEVYGARGKIPGNARDGNQSDHGWEESDRDGDGDGAREEFVVHVAGVLRSGGDDGGDRAAGVI